jgi:cellulose synthase/poly-beta-1,6-N-acetylglucosamine synthase-like glycosyltransferase
MKEPKFHIPNNTKKAIGYNTYRLLYALWVIASGAYFYYRWNFTLGEHFITYRSIILTVEMFSVMIALIAGFFRLRKPYSEYTGQPDGFSIATNPKVYEEYIKQLTDGEEVMSPRYAGDDITLGEFNLKPGRETLPRGTSYRTEIESDSDEDEFVNETKRSKENYIQELEKELKQKEIDALNRAHLRKKLVYQVSDSQSILSLNSATASMRSPTMVSEAGFGIDETEYGKYTVHAIIPCYKESLSVVRDTVMAALNMEHNKLFVYLCDDGEDPDKEEFIMDLKETYKNVFYVTRPEMFKGHGKAGNMNYCLERIIYPDIDNYEDIPTTDVVAVFDADMVPMRQFVSRLLPYFFDKPNVAMVQTPQTFYNVHPDADFFGAHSISFFQHSFPGYSEFDVASCSGTNFLVSSRYLKAVNYFPTASVTEDFYLSMKIHSQGGKIKFHGENLVIGETPEDIREIYKQRSRWCKGTVQVFMHDNPITHPGLTFLQRLAYSHAFFSYIASAFVVPFSLLVTMITVLTGLAPVFDMSMIGVALLVTCYALNLICLMYTPSPRTDYVNIWVANKWAYIFGFMAVKAIFNVLRAGCTKKEFTFKATAKRAPRNPFIAGEEGEDMQEEEARPRDSTRRDIVFHRVMLTLIFTVMIYGIYVLARGVDKGFIPELTDPGTSELKKLVFRLLATLYLMQFVLGYLIPVLYVYIPDKSSTQKATLYFLSALDTLYAFGLLLLLVIGFFAFSEPYPEINSIQDLQVSQSTFWTSPENAYSLRDMKHYFDEQALSLQLPVVTISERPHNIGWMNPPEDISDQFSDYTDNMVKYAKALNQKNFPVIVVLEPGWIEECVSIDGSPGAGVWKILNEGTPDQQYLKLDQNLWNRIIASFTAFKETLTNEDAMVYVDISTPYFYQQFGNDVMDLLHESLSPYNFRGVALNVAKFYSSADVQAAGRQIYEQYGLRFIEDSSRNGGAFSNTTWANQESCPYDPPQMNKGSEPEMVFDEGTGLDFYVYVKEPTASDGRLFPNGEKHQCLLNHNVACDGTCRYEVNEGIYSPSCMC